MKTRFIALFVCLCIHTVIGKNNRRFVTAFEFTKEKFKRSS